MTITQTAEFATITSASAFAAFYCGPDVEDLFTPSDVAEYAQAMLDEVIEAVDTDDFASADMLSAWGF